MKKQRILLVEDEQHLAFGIEFNLKREGYEVQVVQDGVEADKLLTEQAPLFDLVILDLMLPGINGYDICRRLRHAGGRMPVLMLSARSLAEDRTRGFEVGADQYLTKPFDLEELLSRVKGLLARFGQEPDVSRNVVDLPEQGEVSIGEVIVDLGSYQVFNADGEAVQQLTSLEAKLLKYFLRNEGRVISRGELLEEVWEMDFEAVSRAPDQFIRRLRKLLEPDPAHPVFLQTIRDAGYRFERSPQPRSSS